MSFIGWCHMKQKPLAMGLPWTSAVAATAEGLPHPVQGDEFSMITASEWWMKNIPALRMLWIPRDRARFKDIENRVIY